MTSEAGQSTFLSCAGDDAAQESSQMRNPLDELSLVRMAPVLRQSSSERICDDCSSLNLLGALQRAARLRELDDLSSSQELLYGIHIAFVGHRYRQPRETDCALCLILFAARVGAGQGSASVEGDDIRAVEFLTYSRFAKLERYEHDTLQLVVVPRNFGVRYPGGFDLLENHTRSGAAVLLQDGSRPAVFAVQAVPPSFDARPVESWLCYCRVNHTELCSATSSQIPGFQIIDCMTLSVQPAPKDSSYVALSYMWGTCATAYNKVRHVEGRVLLPEKLSSVISDAITVTRALGFQYLWVDKFCIDQDNPAAKHDQIRKMNVIYENAELTIVAAAGLDENYGLPGVGCRPRTPQNTARLDGFTVISTMNDPQTFIRSSRWATRGWTFQEALLSRRRLVFTEEQLYFECNAMNCFESVHSPLDKLHVEDKSKSIDLVRSGMFGTGKIDRYGGHDIHELRDYQAFERCLSALEEYSRKDLSFEVDSLNAFRGIIQWYSRLKHPVHAIWGIPYTDHGKRRASHFSWGLSWYHVKSCWESSGKPTRRYGFPSWSWAGWAGEVQFKPLQHFETYKSASLLRDIRFEDGNSDATLELQSSDPAASMYGCRVLRLMAAGLPLSLFSYQPTMGEPSCWRFAEHAAELSLSHGSISQEQFAQELMDEHRWRCILVSSVRGHTFAMLLQPNRDASAWVRGGMFCIKSFISDIQGLAKYVEWEWFRIE